MSSIILPPNNRIGAIAPILLIITIFWIYPVADVGDPRFSAYYRFGMAAVAFLSVAIWNVNKWAAMFILLAGVSSIFPFSTKYSSEAFRAVMIGCLWFYMVSQIPRDKTKYLLDAICIIALLNVGMLISQYFGFDPIFKPSKISYGTPAVGFLSNKNEVSAILAFCLPAFFRSKWSMLTPLVFVGLSISSSTGGALAAVAATTGYFVIRDGRRFLINDWLLLVALYAWLAVFLGFIDSPMSVFKSKPIAATDAYGYSRFEAWRRGFELYKQHWLLGAGIGHWKIVFKAVNIQGYWFKHAHNEFIQAGFEMGILVAPIVIGYLVGVARKLRTGSILLPAAALVAILTNSMVNFPFHVAQTAIVAVTWMAIMEAK